MVRHYIHAAVKYASHVLHVEKERSFIGTPKEYVKSDFWKDIGGSVRCLKRYSFICPIRLCVMR